MPHVCEDFGPEIHSAATVLCECLEAGDADVLWAKYAAHPKAWDELFAPGRRPHEHCQALSIGSAK